jgi:GGDEF domain-containing protein
MSIAMTDFAFLDRPVEVAANSPRLDMIVTRLKASGLRAYPGRAPIDFTGEEPLLIDLASVSRQTLERVARACMAGHGRQLILLDTTGTNVALTDAISIRRDRDLVLLKARLGQIARRQARAREGRRRLEVAAQLGFKPARIDAEATPHLLYFGDGAERFLHLQGALKERGLGVTAALSALTAQDYLSAHRFTAALVDFSAPRHPAGDFADWTLPTGASAGAPLFALVDPVQEPTGEYNHALTLAAETIACDTGLDVIAAQIERHARYYLASTPLQPVRGLTSTVCDLTTGLFSRGFLEALLSRQMADAEPHCDPLCVLTIKLKGGAATQRETSQAFADLLAPMLRETDGPAYLGGAVFAVSLPATAYRGGVALATRIADIAARKRALGGDALSWRVVERRAYHTPATLLGASLDGPFNRSHAA